jgi:tRNA A37 threonylcarbamoyladenosine modification protein TsaB
VPAAGVSTPAAYAGGRPVIAARRGAVFPAGPSLARPAELAVAGERLVGDGAVRYRDVFEAAGADVPPDDDAAHRPSAALLAARAGDFGPVEALEPLYLRAPDAKEPAR